MTLELNDESRKLIEWVQANSRPQSPEEIVLSALQHLIMEIARSKSSGSGFADEESPLYSREELEKLAIEGLNSPCRVFTKHDSEHFRKELIEKYGPKRS